MILQEEGTVGQLVAETLTAAASTLQVALAENVIARRRLDHHAEVCRRIAPVVERSPTIGCRNAIGPNDLDGRFTPPTERTWGISQVAAWLLEEAATCLNATSIAGAADRVEMLETAAVFCRVADFARIAPAGRLAELGELMPYLRRLYEVAENGGGGCDWPDGALIMVLETPDFYDVASRAYRAAYGREFGDLAPSIQVRWVGVLVETWKADRARLRSPLSSQDRETISYAVAHPRQAWARAPLTGDGWIEQAPADAADILALVSEMHRVGDTQAPFALAHYCDRVRTRQLACHGGSVLVEMQGYLAGGQAGIATAYLTGSGVALADGRSNWILDANDREGAQLRSEVARADYLRLFMNQVRTNERRFETVETSAGQMARAGDPEALARLLRDHPRPIACDGVDESGRFVMSAVVSHGATLFSCRILLSPDGGVEMTDEEILELDLPLLPEAIHGPFVMTVRVQA